MSNSSSFPGPLLRVAVAGLLLASSAGAPLFHGGDSHPGAGYVGPDHAAASFHHDHAACVQLQSSTVGPAAPPEAPAVPGRIVLRPDPRATSAGDLAWSSLPRARSPPRGAAA